MKKHIIILGGGPSGLSLAWRLALQNIQVSIIEGESIVGGLSATVREEKYSLDFGPHSFFSEDAEILKTALNLFPESLPPQQRKVKFFYRGSYLDYPLTPAGVLFQMGLIAGIRSTFSFLTSKIFPKKTAVAEGEDETVETWAINNFGEYLYKSFFKPYTEQFWKVPCNELSSRSIPTHTRMSFLNTLKVILHKRLSKIDPSLIEREKLPTYYPKTGFGEIFEQIAARITKAGGSIHLNSKAVSIHNNADGSVTLEYENNGQKHRMEGDYLVSTIPLHHFVRMLHPEPPREVLESTRCLDYRAMVALGIVTEKQDILDCGYIYLLDRPYNRISEMNKFSPDTSPPGDNILCLEVCCLKGSAGWNASKEELFEMCIPSLAEDGLLQPGDVKKLLLVKAPYAYPIYRKDYAIHLKTLLDEVNKRKNIATLGRTGEFMYMDSDKCMRRSFDFAEKLLQKLNSQKPCE